MNRKTLDFLERLNDHVETLGLYATCYLSMLEPEESIALLALPGGVEIVFMDGARDKDYNVQFNAKSRNQADCIGALNAIASELESLSSLPSLNDSYEFDKFVVPNLPSFVTQDEQGFFIWQLTLTAKITIFKGVV